MNIQSEYEKFKREAQWMLDHGHISAARDLCVAADHLATILELQRDIRLIQDQIDQLLQSRFHIPTHTLH